GIRTSHRLHLDSFSGNDNVCGEKALPLGTQIAFGRSAMGTDPDNPCPERSGALEIRLFLLGIEEFRKIEFVDRCTALARINSQNIVLVVRDDEVFVINCRGGRGVAHPGKNCVVGKRCAKKKWREEKKEPAETQSTGKFHFT